MGNRILVALFIMGTALQAAAYELPSSTGTHRVRFEADAAGFNEYTRVIDLEGNVRLEELSADGKQQKLIRARSLSVNIPPLKASCFIWVIASSRVAITGNSNNMYFAK